MLVQVGASQMLYVGKEFNRQRVVEFGRGCECRRLAVQACLAGWRFCLQSTIKELEYTGMVVAISSLGVCWAFSARGWLQAYRAAAEAGDPLGGVLEKELLREVTALVDASGALRQQALSQAMTQVCFPLAPRGLGCLVSEA